jgi:TonB family protein
MIKKLIACFLLSLPLAVLAQTAPRTVGYFNEEWKEVSEKELATYYRTVEDQPDGRFLVRDYYMSGQLQMEPTICTAYTPKLMWEGVAKLYHENGKVKEEGFFKNEDRQGVHQYWYDNGTPNKIVWHAPDGRVKFHQVWSKSGKELLVNGNGTIEDPQWEILGGTYYMEIRDSISIASYTYNETIGDTVYLLIEKVPEYQGGLENMYRTISSNMKYPVTARRLGTEGTVFIGFVVDEQGKSMAHEVLKGISRDCDKEALRVSKLLNSWNPGVHRGKPVKVKFVLPIKYKLS